MLQNFSKIWVVDFEYYFSNPGNLPIPVCLVAKELITGETLKVWLEGNDIKIPPYSIDSSSLFIAYFSSSAELLCHHTLNWKIPYNVLDLFTEFRTTTNGLPVSSSLLSACSQYNIETITDIKKEAMRERILKGAPFSDLEKEEILDYCESDVTATCKLYEAMKPQIDWDRALFRGAYMGAVASMEYVGIPIDVETLTKLREHWEEIKLKLIEVIDKNFGFYEGTTFKIDRFAEYLIKNKMAWEQTPTGQPKLDEDTFKQMVKTYPQLQPIHDLRYALSKLKLNDLSVGDDGRNRTILSPFRAKTGRNQPSTSKFIFGLSVWLRGLIKPTPGKVLAYIDYSSEEFYIAAILSNDKVMQKTYETGDPYLAFAKMAGAVPETATKQSHGAIREQFKICALAVQYGMESRTLAFRINRAEIYARELIEYHKRFFPGYWRWQQEVLRQAKFNRIIRTCYGWNYHIIDKTTKEDGTLKNFLMQATGAEILRVACYLLVEAGIRICAPIHDAVLIECDIGNAETTVKQAQEIMQLASQYVLGKPIRTDATIIKYPERYHDKRAGNMWEKVMGIITDLETNPQTFEYYEKLKQQQTEKLDKYSKKHQSVWYEGQDKDTVDFEALRDSTLTNSENKAEIKKKWKDFL